MIKALTALCFVVGIVLMGQEGVLFPWVNLLGAVVFAMIVPLSSRA